MKKKLKKLLKIKKSRKVYCLFAHLFFDRPIIDNTNLFNGMPDWVSKIIDIFNESDHILLIKPHVAETFYPESKKPQQTLINFLKSKTMRKISLYLNQIYSYHPKSPKLLMLPLFGDLLLLLKI